ncbi:mannose-6-phosphate isomerase, class I [Pantoea sp. SoEX]|uniref:mannose-6-phosphate isomerase, class I n=1 Tax=Pantoea sp. SoEX TaxID=2576763 RepID=UPI00135BA47A|nr:mannose-6-phosphate isomerase, class I [Pantoea sp. SoEX]MXP50955.1 mannose-6-phosphate isomerase, class I [Pantoea sp. SoEX]
MILKLKNSLKFYKWGSIDFLADTYNIHNSKKLPIAELWIGTHYQNPSKVYYNNQLRLLSEIINIDPDKFLGNAVAKYFGELPFLFKILCIDNPLSIQVHPKKSFAKRGFLKENKLSIKLDMNKRNYKDKNHKPELIYAITDFHALIGFRNCSQIIPLLDKIIDIHPLISKFQNRPNNSNLLKLLKYFLCLKNNEKIIALKILKSNIKYLKTEPWKTIKNVMINYPEDNGLFLLIFLNIFSLKPGEALFVPPGIPHTYLKGNAIEISANSDNVIRAGLTSKHIDISDFLINIQFKETFKNQILIKTKKLKNEIQFLIPIKDFAFAVHSLQNIHQTIYQKSMAILFCISGEFSIIKNNKNILFKSGESCFVSADEMPIIITGNGCIARVFNKDMN